MLGTFGACLGVATAHAQDAAASTAAARIIARAGLSLEKVLSRGGIDDLGLAEMEPADVARIMRTRRKLFVGYVDDAAALPRSLFIYAGDSAGSLYLVEVTAGVDVYIRGWGPLASGA